MVTPDDPAAAALLAAPSGFSPADRLAILADFAPADAVAPGLGFALARFVVLGEDEDLFARVAAVLAADGTAADLLGASLSLSSYEPHDWPEPDGAYADRVARRRRVLKGRDGFDAAGMRRLGMLIAAAPHHAYGLAPGTKRSPPWLQHLFATMALPPDEALEGSHLTAAQMRDMLRMEGGTAAAIVDVVFGRARYGDSSAAALPDLADALAAEPESVLGAVDHLSPRQAGALTLFFGGSGLLDRVPAFLDRAFLAAGSAAAEVREPALVALGLADRGRVARRAEAALGATSVAERLAGVRAVAALGGEGAAARLDAHAAGEKAKPVLTLIAALRPRLALSAGAAARADGAEGYTAVDGAWIEAPPRRDGPDTVPADAAALLGELMAASAAASRAEYDADGQPDWKLRGRGPYAPPHDPARIPALVAFMAGATKAPGQRKAIRCDLAGELPTHFYETQAAYVRGLERLFARPDFGVRALTRVSIACDVDWSRSLWELIGRRTLHVVPSGRELVRRLRDGADFREVVDVLEQHGIAAAHHLPKLVLRMGENLGAEFEPGPAVWPAFAAQFEAIDAALAERAGLERAQASVAVLGLCALFPAPPRRHLPVLFDCAVRGSDRARALLAGAGDLTPAIAPRLRGGTAAARAEVARLLGHRRDPTAVPALRAALAAERDAAARDAVLAALLRCGDDLSDQATEERLLAEAERDAAKPSADYGSLADSAALPALRWADGRAVDTRIVAHLFARAHAAKKAGGDALLGLVLARLDRGDLAALGADLLARFVALDTRRASLDEANVAAEAGADRLLRAHARDPGFTREAALAELRRDAMARYSGSAIAHSGLLALCRFAPAAEAVPLVRRYLKDHGTRPAQCRALLDTLAADPVPAKLQALVAAAQGHRQPGARRHAAELVAAVAEERGWTAAELADRSVPTLDLDEAGTLPLALGGRTYRLRLDGGGAEGPRFVLASPEGRTVSALPSLKAPGEAEAAKAAKKAVSAARAELKRTAALQTARLHEAMCLGRRWPAADMAEVFIAHPVMRHLLRRLVLSLHGPGGGGGLVGTARLLDDGTLTGLDDEAVRLDGVAAVGIAHRATLGEAAARAWTAHLADYGVVPLFPHVDRPAPDPFDPAGDEIADRRGHAVDAAALLAAAARLGYAPGPARGMGISDYQKPFAGAGLAASVGFSGARVDERRRGRDALHGLRFLRLRGGRPADPDARGVPLGRVPPVLLEEAWADYRALAAVGTGFEPDWETLGPW